MVFEALSNKGGRDVNVGLAVFNLGKFDQICGCGLRGGSLRMSGTTLNLRGVKAGAVAVYRKVRSIWIVEVELC